MHEEMRIIYLPFGRSQDLNTAAVANVADKMFRATISGASETESHGDGPARRWRKTTGGEQRARHQNRGAPSLLLNR